MVWLAWMLMSPSHYHVTSPAVSASETSHSGSDTIITNSASVMTVAVLVLMISLRVDVHDVVGHL